VGVDAGSHNFAVEQPAGSHSLAIGLVLAPLATKAQQTTNVRSACWCRSSGTRTIARSHPTPWPQGSYPSADAGPRPVSELVFGGCSRVCNPTQGYGVCLIPYSMRSSSARASAAPSPRAVWRRTARRSRELPCLAWGRNSRSSLSARAHVTHQFAAFCRMTATKYRILNALGMTNPLPSTNKLLKLLHRAVVQWLRRVAFWCAAGPLAFVTV
jgi:hypothetical protein